jgi:hypothetical protein
MDYKAVIEEQIKESQEVQKHAIALDAYDSACKVAETIAELCKVASSY